jgi:tetratricopeptide (TPR) repeat protein
MGVFLHDPIVVFSIVTGAASLLAYFYPALNTLRKFLAVLALSAVVLAAGDWLRRTAKPAPVPVDTAALRTNFNSALAAARTGDYTQALKLYKAIEQKSPEFPTIHLQQAFCLFELGRLDEAQAEAERAVFAIAEAGGREGFVRIGVPEYLLATVLFTEGKPALAADALRHAIADGFPYACEAAADGDLAAMRTDPNVRDLVLTIRAREETCK